MFTRQDFSSLDVAKINASTSTILRVLKKRKIHARRAAQKLFLSPAHAEQRMIFATNFVNRPEEWWQDVIFCDEKSFGWACYYLFNSLIFNNH